MLLDVHTNMEGRKSRFRLANCIPIMLVRSRPLSGLE